MNDVLEKIQLKEMNYFNRYINSFLGWFFFFFFIISLIVIRYNYWPMFFFLGVLLLIHTYISFKESIYYIFEIKLNKISICYKYMKFNKPMEKTVDLRALEIRVINSGFGLSSLTSSCLRFIVNEKIIFKQYSTGEWDEKKMLELKKRIDELKNSNPSNELAE